MREKIWIIPSMKEELICVKNGKGYKWYLKSAGEYYYWEHFGMMDNPEYASPACRKIKTYCDNGIIPSINLIMTYETSACPIGMERIEQVAEYYFG